MIHHAAFGLRLEATTHIPGLDVVEGAAGVAGDIRLWVQQHPQSSSTEQLLYGGLDRGQTGGVPVQVSWLPDDSMYCFRYRDGTAFYIDRGGRDVWTTWREPNTIEDMATYLLGPVLGFVLRLRGVTPLHASAVCVGQRALALLGRRQAGKSTTAAAFAMAGFPVLSDDVSAIDERDGAFYVRAGYSHLRLWPRAVEMLFGSREALRPITPNWNKRDFPLTGVAGTKYAEQPSRLAAIYILGVRSDDSRAPFVETLTPAECFMTLITNTYVNYALDETMRRADFELIGRLVSAVPIRRVVPHADPQRVWQLRDTILADFSQTCCD